MEAMDDARGEEEAARPLPGPPRRPEAAEGPDPVDAGEIDERLRATEALPLGERAEGYQALHDELVARLDEPQAGA